MMVLNCFGLPLPLYLLRAPLSYFVGMGWAGVVRFFNLLLIKAPPKI